MFDPMFDPIDLISFHLSVLQNIRSFIKYWTLVTDNLEKYPPPSFPGSTY